MQHFYEVIAQRVVYDVTVQMAQWKTDKLIFLLREDREECERVAVLCMCEIARIRPHLSGNKAYLKKAARNRVLTFLLGKNGWLNWKRKPIKRSISFVEKHLLEIYNLLVGCRSKKGKRGSVAATRDLQIILLASFGWNNSEIGKELGIKPDNIKKYRQSIIKRLLQVLESKESKNADC